MISKHSQTKYFILDPNAAIATGSSTLYNGAGVLNLGVGSAGFYGPVPGSGNHVEVATAPAGPERHHSRSVCRRCARPAQSAAPLPEPA